MTDFTKMTWFFLGISIVLVSLGLWAVSKLGGWDATLFRLKNKGLSGIYENRKSFFKVLQIDSIDIIWLGDSHTEKGAWGEVFKDLRHKNRGISGDYAEGVLKRLPVVLDGKPKTIFLMVGTNDLLMGMTSDRLMEYYQDVVLAIQKGSPNTQLVVQSVLPINSKKWTLPNKNSEIVNFNAKLQAYTRSLKLEYIDLHQLFVDENGQLDEKYTQDGIHLNGDAYLIWIKTIRPMVARL